MRQRTRGREFALQLLYQVELTKDKDHERILAFWQQLEENQPGGPITPDTRDFAMQLFHLVDEKHEDIDKEIAACAEHWEMDRMAIVDRNILRLGVGEILFIDDIPPKVSINEAIELAKKYGDAESARFVNGVLDHVAKNKAQ